VVGTELRYSPKTSFLVLVTNSQMFPLLLNMFISVFLQTKHFDG